MNLKDFTSSRLSWALLFIFSWGFVAFAVGYSYFFDKAPCYLCIMQRISLLIIGLFGLFVLINPKNHLIRKIGYLGWFGGNSLGLYFAYKLVDMQNNPPLFSSCSMDSNALLDKFGWMEALPILFNGSGDCSVSTGVYFGLSFEKWALLMFSIFIIVLFSILLIRTKQRIN